MPTQPSDRFNSRLAQARARRGFSQAALAERLADFGITGLFQSSISDLEHGRRDLSFNEAYWIAKVLNVSLDALSAPESWDEYLVEEAELGR